MKLKRFFLYGVPKSFLIKIILFLAILLFGKNVFAAEFNMSNNTSATQGGTKGYYNALEIYNSGSLNRYKLNTRYNGQISTIETFFEYPFVGNTTYRFTYNMATEDFRNNFSTSYWWDCSQSMTSSNAHALSVSYISYKKVQYSIKPSDNTTCIKVELRSRSPSSVAITGINNWNLSSITLYDPDWQSGSGGGQGTATPTPSPSNNQDIINNQNNNTQDIINNQNDNTNNIIENNNNNTEEIKDTIKDELNNCHDSYNLWSFNSEYTNPTGVDIWTLPDTEFSLPAGTYTFSADITKTNSGSNPFILFNYKYGSLSDNIVQIFNSHTFTFTDDVVRVALYLPSNTSIKNIMLNEGSTAKAYEPYGQEICSSKLDDTTNAINNLNDTMKDETTPNIDIDLDLSNDNPISSLLTMPLTLLNAVFDMTDDTCQPYVLPFDFFGGNNTLSLPCIDLKDYLGNNVYNILDTILCFYFAYEIGMMCISIYEGITSLHDNFDSLYSPKHGPNSYTPRHGGD